MHADTNGSEPAQRQEGPDSSILAKTLKDFLREVTRAWGPKGALGALIVAAALGVSVSIYLRNWSVLPIPFVVVMVVAWLTRKREIVAPEGALKLSPLSSSESGDRELLQFGRQADIQDICNLVLAGASSDPKRFRAGVVYGESGVGKSSLFAGVIPAL
jgi:hypothetical protein